MSIPFASGKHARGVCDRCGRGDLKLKELKWEIFNQRRTGFLVCTDGCWDIDQPQLQLGRFPVNDPQALRNPRPDAGLTKSRILWGWNPVGNQSTQVQAFVGSVYVNGELT